MKINRVIPGQYSEAKLEEGGKIFFSVLPDRITISEMFLFIPTKKFWEFIFPFYIRTADEAWKSSEQILEIVIDSIKDTKTLDELKERLETQTNKALRDYIKKYGEEAQDLSVDKVGIHAIKKMLDPKDLRKIEVVVHEYGKLQEAVSKDMLTKYPAMVFPESLLPYPKEKVKKALQDAIQYTDDQKMVENLGSCLVFLKNFINDEEANRKNSELLENKEWQTAIKKHLQKKDK